MSAAKEKTTREVLVFDQKRGCEWYDSQFG